MSLLDHAADLQLEFDKMAPEYVAGWLGQLGPAVPHRDAPRGAAAS